MAGRSRRAGVHTHCLQSPVPYFVCCVCLLHFSQGAVPACGTRSWRYPCLARAVTRRNPHPIWLKVDPRLLSPTPQSLSTCNCPVPSQSHNWHSRCPASVLGVPVAVSQSPVLCQVDGTVRVHVMSWSSRTRQTGCRDPTGSSSICAAIGDVLLLTSTSVDLEHDQLCA